MAGSADVAYFKLTIPGCILSKPVKLNPDNYKAYMMPVNEISDETRDEFCRAITSDFSTQIGNRWKEGIIGGFFLDNPELTSMIFTALLVEGKAVFVLCGSLPPHLGVTIPAGSVDFGLGAVKPRSASAFFPVPPTSIPITNENTGFFSQK